jgi:hypothetical protein
VETSPPFIGLEAFAHANDGFHPAEITGSVSSRASHQMRCFLYIHEAPVIVVLAHFGAGSDGTLEVSA